MTPLTDRVFYDIDSAMRANPSGNHSPVFKEPPSWEVGEPIPDPQNYNRYEVKKCREELFGKAAGVVTFWRWVKTH